MAERPNIVVVITDTSRCDTLASYGNPHAISPYLDRLAGEGVLFEQAHTPAPVCMPARCSLLTGVHTPIHGCIENGIARRTDLLTLPDVLEAAGYHNMLVGKAHFGPIPESFHTQRVLRGEKDKDADDFYAHHLRDHGYARASRHPNAIPEELFCDAFLIDTTIRLIDEHRSATGKQPFFALCSLPSPHRPLDPPGSWAHAYDDRPLPPVNFRDGELERLPASVRRLVAPSELVDPLIAGANGPDWTAIDARRRLYYGLAAYCDAQIGRLLDYLDSSGLHDETLVVFTSDHGQQYYDHGFNDKHTFYDASWRIPLIMRWPGNLPAGTRAGFATWTDVTATILAAAGQDVPSVQGFDLVAPLRDGRSSPRRSVASVLYRSLAVVTQRWKLEYHLDDATGRLFDRVNDAVEQDDRYNDPNLTGVRNALLDALLTWRAELNDVEYLQDRRVPGGPVAKRVAAHAATLRGSDAERRLGERTALLDRAVD